LPSAVCRLPSAWQESGDNMSFTTCKVIQLPLFTPFGAELQSKYSWGNCHHRYNIRRNGFVNHHVSFILRYHLKNFTLRIPHPMERPHQKEKKNGRGVKFAVISYQRTGSTFFVSMLNGIDGVVCHSELFNRGLKTFGDCVFDPKLLPELNFFEKLTGRTKAEKLFRFKKRDPLGFLNHVYSYRDAATGFKIFPGQDDSVFNHILEERSIRKIILTRNNLLRSYVSRTIAHKTGIWGRHKGEEASLEKVSVDTERFLEYARRIKDRFGAIEAGLEAANQRYLKCTYEQITESYPAREICTFLDIPVPGTVPEISWIRQNPFALSDMIENYSEVKNALEGTEFQTFLADSQRR